MMRGRGRERGARIATLSCQNHRRENIYKQFVLVIIIYSFQVQDIIEMDLHTHTHTQRDTTRGRTAENK